MNHNALSVLGWNPFFESQLKDFSIPGFQVARVTVENRTNYVVSTGEQEFIAESSGKLLFTSMPSELPKVGDWVVVTPMDTNRVMVHAVLKRFSSLSRRAAGKDVQEQVIAVNIDVLFIVQGLDDNFSPERIERYLSAVENIEPIVVLNKADVASDAEATLQQLRQRLPQVEVITTSALNDDIAELRALITPGKTYAFAGSSGVGKSSLINRLSGSNVMETFSVREKDSKGRHTTTRRQMIILPGGGIVIDTPGMREFQPWSDDVGTEAFSDIDLLATSCRYANCQHTHETDCAVKDAVGRGDLDPARYENYLRLRREIEYQQSLVDVQKARDRKQQAKQRHKAYNQIVRNKRK